MSDVRIDGLGVSVLVDIEDPSLHPVISSLWSDLSDGAVPVTVVQRVRVSGHGPWSITSDGGAAHVVRSSPEVVSAVCAAINEPIATSTPLLTAHAAVVVRDGRGLVIPGPSGQGKTTLTVALLQQGWRYVTDEALALDWDTGQPVGYPRPLGVSVSTAEMLGVRGGIEGDDEYFMRASELGAEIGRQPFEIAAIALLNRDGSVASLVPEHRMEALEALVRRGFTHRRDPGLALRLLAGVVRGAKAYELRYGDAGHAAELLSKTLL